MTTYKVGIMLFFLWLVALSKKTSRLLQLHRTFVASLAILFPLLLSNIVWPHYPSFLFLPILFLLFQTKGLNRTDEALVWLTLFSTMAVHSRFIQRYLLSFLEHWPLARAVVAGLCGGATMLLALILLVTLGDHMRRFRSGHDLTEGPL